MADELTAFLIAVAQDEKKLERFLKDPKKEAVDAGLSRGEIATLMTRNAHKIFEALHELEAAGWSVWVSPPTKRSTRPTRPVRKARARRRR